MSSHPNRIRKKSQKAVEAEADANVFDDDDVSDNDNDDFDDEGGREEVQFGIREEINDLDDTDDDDQNLPAFKLHVKEEPRETDDDEEMGDFSGDGDGEGMNAIMGAEQDGNDDDEEEYSNEFGASEEPSDGKLQNSETTSTAKKSRYGYQVVKSSTHFSFINFTRHILLSNDPSSTQCIECAMCTFSVPRVREECDDVALKHALKHVDGYLFHCHFCDYKSRQKSSIQTHIRRIHNLTNSALHYTNEMDARRQEIMDLIQRCYGSAKKESSDGVVVTMYSNKLEKSELADALFQYCKETIKDSHEPGSVVTCSVCCIRLNSMWSGQSVMGRTSLDHVFKHLSGRPFECNHCEYTSKTKRDMLSHFKDVHQLFIYSPSDFTDKTAVFFEEIKDTIDRCYNKQYADETMDQNKLANRELFVYCKKVVTDYNKPNSLVACGICGSEMGGLWKKGSLHGGSALSHAMKHTRTRLFACKHCNFKGCNLYSTRHHVTKTHGIDAKSISDDDLIDTTYAHKEEIRKLIDECYVKKGAITLKPTPKKKMNRQTPFPKFSEVMRQLAPPLLDPTAAAESSSSTMDSSSKNGQHDDDEEPAMYFASKTPFGAPLPVEKRKRYNSRPKKRSLEDEPASSSTASKQQPKPKKTKATIIATPSIDREEEQPNDLIMPPAETSAPPAPLDESVDEDRLVITEEDAGIEQSSDGPTIKTEIASSMAFQPFDQQPFVETAAFQPPFENQTDGNQGATERKSLISAAPITIADGPILVAPGKILIPIHPPQFIVPTSVVPFTMANGGGAFGPSSIQHVLANHLRGCQVTTVILTTMQSTPAISTTASTAAPTATTSSSGAAATTSKSKAAAASQSSTSAAKTDERAIRREEETGLTGELQMNSMSSKDQLLIDFMKHAIRASPHQRMTTKEMYDWIDQNAQFIKEKDGEITTEAKWKNRIRNCLRRDKNFMSILADSTHNLYWLVAEDHTQVKQSEIDASKDVSPTKSSMPPKSTIKIHDDQPSSSESINEIPPGMVCINGKWFMKPVSDQKSTKDKQDEGVQRTAGSRRSGSTKKKPKAKASALIRIGQQISFGDFGEQQQTMEGDDGQPIAMPVDTTEYENYE